MLIALAASAVAARVARQVMELLNSWDTDQNGLIDKKEFRNACRAMGVLYDRDVLDKLFDWFDDDGRGATQFSHMRTLR